MQSSRTAQSHCHLGGLTPALALCGGPVDSGHWSCWGGLAWPLPPHVAWFWLDHPRDHALLFSQPSSILCMPASFPIFVQDCVVLCSIFFNFAFGRTSHMSLISYVAPLVLEILTSPLTARVATGVRIIGFWPRAPH